MYIQVLKSKLKKVKVTGASIDYEGSITLGPELMYAAGLQEYERVEVNSVDGKARIVTYAITGKTGQVELNGGAANFFKSGDWVHVNCFGFVDEHECIDYEDEYGRCVYKINNPDIVITDENNKIIE